MCREGKKVEFPKKYYIWIWKQQGWEVDREIDVKMKWRRMGDYLVYKGGRKGYITERNGRSSWEWQRIISFCTCQWNEWVSRLTVGFWCQVSSTCVDVDCFNIVYTVHHISHQFYLSTVNAHYLWANHSVTITPSRSGFCVCHLQGVLDFPVTR